MHETHIKRIIAGFCLFLLGFYGFAIRPPAHFPVNTPIEVKRGASLSAVANELARQGVIRSPYAYKIIVYITGGSKGVIAGDYLFDAPETLFGVIAKTTDVLFGISSVRVTIPEGVHNRQVAEILAKKLTHFDKEKFIIEAAPLEGYLFPDTYIFAKGISETDVISAMYENFQEQIKTIETEIEKSGRTLKDIVSMASLLEREARTKETRRMVAGILWKRLDTGHLLQVDAVFMYLLGKPSAELTREELALDSPYNTYKYKGLPAGPIGNPGLYAMRDAADYKTSPYWFYLSDSWGRMHYAVTYDQHKANIQKYLR